MSIESSLEHKISATIKKSRFSFFSTVLFLIIIFIVLFTTFQQITELQGKVSSLNEEVNKKEIEVQELNRKISITNQKVKESQVKLDTYYDAIEIFHTGLRRLQSRQYSKATKAFSDFIKIVPESPQAFHILGYSEYRYFLHWKENLLNRSANVDVFQQTKWEKLANNYFNRSTSSFNHAIELNNSYMWPEYHMILLNFYAGKYEQSIAYLRSTVTKHPEILDYLCDDGEFRKMRKNQKTSLPFVEIISNALNNNELGRKSCWVISVYKSTLISEIQRLLNKLGYDAGVPDGIVGSKTVYAVKKFEEIEKMEITGIPNNTLLSALQKVSKN